MSESNELDDATQLSDTAAERRARHAESMRDSWQIILSDIEAEREDG